MIRTVQLPRRLSDAPLRRRVTAETNKVESFNRSCQWIGFGHCGVIADNDPVEQGKAMKFNALLTNAVIFHNALDIAEIVRQLLEGGWETDPEDLATISPYLTEHINRLGECSTHELGIQPEAYDPKPDVDFAPLRDQDLAAAGFGQAGHLRVPAALPAVVEVRPERPPARPTSRVVGVQDVLDPADTKMPQAGVLWWSSTAPSGDGPTVAPLRAGIRPGVIVRVPSRSLVGT